jgi:hypothetical protein
MTEKDKEEIERQLMELSLKGSELMGGQLGVRRSIREKWKSEAGKLIDAHQFAFAVAADIVLKKAAVPGKTSKSVDRRLSLIASFVQGVDICETTISEGLYLQAAALLKQEMETVTALDEVLRDRRKDKRTPNVGNARFLWMKNVYGELNDAAHVGDENVLRSLVSRRIAAEVTGAFLHPPYNKELSFYFYGLHVMLIIVLALQAADLHEEMYGERITPLELRTLVLAQDILKEVGWIQLEE